MKELNVLIFRETLFTLLSSKYWRKIAADSAAVAKKGDFFGAKALDKMTHAVSFSKLQMLCQSGDNFCVFKYRKDFKSYNISKTGHEYSVCHLPM